MPSTPLFDAVLFEDGVAATPGCARWLEHLSLQIAVCPEADFIRAAWRLHVQPKRAIVVSDSIADVADARADGFGLVIGVASAARRSELRRAGAHVVVDDLAELVPAPPDRLAA